MSRAKSNALRGYKRPGYKWSKSIKQYKKTGYFKTVAGGSGHDAGKNWGDAKNIDENSPQRRYSKNSPSFDEGVWQSKQNRKQRALESMMQKTITKVS